MTDGNRRTSSHSNPNGECVEIGQDGTAVTVRDTKDRSGPELAFSPAAWREFTRRARSDAARA